ncbi:dUTP diphosphatase [Escherichia coli]|uniref:dUTP diphosphatase n=1 Tax=Escherichia coli TaxID=562 RepID=UPI002458F63F|nr:dUTP diphosphatase [Escherichia coli]MDH4772902.1 dUTP diphosphatase [Escherichia coli]MDO8868348.1 dUTP diphosphatase [Escherichia coli]
MIYVKVKRLHPAAKLPAYATSGSAAMDFEAVEIKPCVDSNGAISSSWWVYTGLAMEIPPGWCLKLYPRSGLGCKKHTRLANCVGIIDSDYRGEIMAKLITDPGGEGVCLKPGMAVMQGIFERVEQVSLVEVEELNETERGAGGITTQQEEIDLEAADFSDALMWLKDGKKVARRGWNGENQFCWLVPEGQYPARMEAIKGYFPGDLVPYGAYFALKNAQGVVVPWVPSVGDLLACDWFVVE